MSPLHKKSKNIFLHGLAGSGKDTVAEYLAKEYGYVRIALADKVKEIARDILGYTGKKDRHLLIALGQGMRKIDPEVWIKYVANQINKNLHFKYVITDVRMKNEFWYFKNLGFIGVKVWADEKTRYSRLQKRDKHLNIKLLKKTITEKDLDLPFDKIILNNSNLSILYSRVDNLFPQL